MTYTAEQIEAIGGKRWTKGDITRVYISDDTLADLVGLDVTRYRTGNIQSATLRGERVSNTEAKRILGSTVYWESGDLRVRTESDHGDTIRAAVHAAVTPDVEDDPEPPAEVPASTERPAPSGVQPLTYMLSIGEVTRQAGQRGHRWHVSARVRPREFCAGYFATAEQAEHTRAWLAEHEYRDIQVLVPAHAADLAALGQDRVEARRILDEKTAALRAGVLQAVEEGREETEIARTAGVDRMTVRAWVGKR
jgi:hypothetical protein